MARTTQARLAEDSGISVDHLSKIERGLSSPSFAVMERIAAGIGVHPASLFEDGAARQDLTAPDSEQTYLRELNHRIKNSYSILVALADLACMDARTEETRTACRDMSAKIRHMALLHDLLSGRNMDDTIDLRHYLQRIFRQLAALHPHSRLGMRIKADEVLLPARKAMPFGLAAFELLTNVYKHAGTASFVDILVRDEGRDRVTVTVSDDGHGLRAKALGNGRGLSLVRTLVTDQLGGAFEIRAHNGTTAELSFRITD